ncbi:MAG: hypothetical protein KGL00_08700 [Gammaproteobacteria bacterium]|nr:hypothetical protein [Gammaproteobacteria bacterium]MDE2024624.1 hypothetical protein [Gammaproteobacteria bacterium]MDE2140477.1 hypothetical protein [Gammaproteobacteria bacterium]MDE2274268.1 hypothetical protein [Gammaproteobacteria bacterium]
MVKASVLEDVIRNSDDSGMDSYVPGAAGRKRGAVVKQPKPQYSSQAWRRLEDRLNDRRLRHKLKEVYEDD